SRTGLPRNCLELGDWVPNLVGFRQSLLGHAYPLRPSVQSVPGNPLTARPRATIPLAGGSRVARVEMVLGPAGVLMMAPNNPVFLATLSVAELELSWNQQYQCWWAPAFKYFELMAIVREFFTVGEDYPDDYVLGAIDPFRRYPALAGHLEAL